MKVLGIRYDILGCIRDYWKVIGSVRECQGVLESVIECIRGLRLLGCIKVYYGVLGTTYDNQGVLGSIRETNRVYQRINRDCQRVQRCIRDYYIVLGGGIKGYQGVIRELSAIRYKEYKGLGAQENRDCQGIRGISEYS